MIITILVHKGGAGKTTTAVNLAAALARADRPVKLVDVDNLQIGAEHYKEGIEGVEYTKVLPEGQETHGFVVVDTPPAINKDVGDALLASDLVIVMASPAGAVLKEVPQTLRNVEKVLEKSPDTKVRVLFSYATKTNKMEGLLEGAKAFCPFPVFDTTIPERRADMERTYAQARAIVNSNPKSPVAIAYRELATEIEAMFNGDS